MISEPRKQGRMNAPEIQVSVRFKTLMLIESIASFLTVGLVAARAVNTLNT